MIDRQLIFKNFISKKFQSSESFLTFNQCIDLIKDESILEQDLENTDYWFNSILKITEIYIIFNHFKDNKSKNYFDDLSDRINLFFHDYVTTQNLYDNQSLHLFFFKLFVEKPEISYVTTVAKFFFYTQDNFDFFDKKLFDSDIYVKIIQDNYLNFISISSVSNFKKTKNFFIQHNILSENIFISFSRKIAFKSTTTSNYTDYLPDLYDCFTHIYSISNLIPIEFLYFINEYSFFSFFGNIDKFKNFTDLNQFLSFFEKNDNNELYNSFKILIEKKEFKQKLEDF